MGFSLNTQPGQISLAAATNWRSRHPLQLYPTNTTAARGRRRRMLMLGLQIVSWHTSYCTIDCWESVFRSWKLERVKAKSLENGIEAYFNMTVFKTSRSSNHGRPCLSMSDTGMRRASTLIRFQAKEMVTPSDEHQYANYVVPSSRQRQFQTRNFQGHQSHWEGLRHHVMEDLDNRVSCQGHPLYFSVLARCYFCDSSCGCRVPFFLTLDPNLI